MHGDLLRKCEWSKLWVVLVQHPSLVQYITSVTGKEGSVCVFVCACAHTHEVYEEWK